MSVCIIFSFKGVYLFVSNDREYLKGALIDSIRAFLGISDKLRPLNEKIIQTDMDYIPTEYVEEFIEFNAKRPVGMDTKLLVLHDVHLLKNNVSDKLLKTLEDLRGDTFIVLTTDSLFSVSTTIRSRSFIWKEEKDVEEYFVYWKNKYLSFIDKIKEVEFEELPEVYEQIQNLGGINIIKAMFVNCTDSVSIEIAKKSLQTALSSVKEQQLLWYIIYAIYQRREDICT